LDEANVWVFSRALSSSSSGPRSLSLIARKAVSHSNCGDLPLEASNSTLNTDINLLLLGSTDNGCTNAARPVTTVARYSGTKALAVYDDRRAVAVYELNPPHSLALYQRPGELAVNNRPSAIIVYRSPINFIRFWQDPRPYQLIIYLYRPLFRDDTYLSNRYAHLDPKDFDRLVSDAAHDLVERELAKNWNRAHLLSVLNVDLRMCSTIGEIRRRPEECASRALVIIHGLGLVAALACVAMPWLFWLIGRCLHWVR
jgi:hypothetical protein